MGAQFHQQLRMLTNLAQARARLRTLTQRERDVMLEGAQKTWVKKAHPLHNLSFGRNSIRTSSQGYSHLVLVFNPILVHLMLVPVTRFQPVGENELRWHQASRCQHVPCRFQFLPCFPFCFDGNLRELFGGTQLPWAFEPCRATPTWMQLRQMRI